MTDLIAALEAAEVGGGGRFIYSPVAGSCKSLPCPLPGVVRLAAGRGGRARRGLDALDPALPIATRAAGRLRSAGGGVMVDLVGTCPMDFWQEWIAEGDAAGDPVTGETWGWYTRHRLVHEIEPGDRFYVVAHGKLRGWAPVVNVDINAIGSGVIERRGGAVACTIDEPIPGFRGLRKPWWPRRAEKPFPDWRTP